MTAPSRSIHYVGPAAEIWEDPDVGVAMAPGLDRLPAQGDP